MPKVKNDQDVELDFGSDERELTGSDANPIDAGTGETLFDDLSPRFVRQLDAAVGKADGKQPKPAAADQEDEDDDLDPVDEELENEDSETDEDADEPRVTAGEEDDEEHEQDEDADEPRPGRKPTAIEKRIARADRLLDESRAQIVELQQREAQREARDKLAASEKEFTSFKSETDKKLADLKAKKVKALEDGDTATVVEVDDEIIELRSELRSRERDHERAKKEIEEVAKRRPVSAITAVKVAQWKRKNPRFESDPEFKAVVIAIDRELANSGSNTETDEHYKELDRRLKKLYPERAKTPRVRRHPSQQVTRESSPGERRPETRAVVKNGKLKISPSKLARVKANMTKFGLDPSNKRDLQDYILNNPGI